jgi:hypothetical protein
MKTFQHILKAALDRIRRHHAIDPTYAAQARVIADEDAAQTGSDPLAGRMVADRNPAPQPAPNSRARRRSR